MINLSLSVCLLRKKQSRFQRCEQLTGDDACIIIAERCTVVRDLSNLEKLCSGFVDVS